MAFFARPPVAFLLFVDPALPAAFLRAVVAAFGLAPRGRFGASSTGAAMTADDATPPRSRVVRAARLAAMPAGHACRNAVGLDRRLGGHPAEAVAAQVQQRTAEQLFATLGELKGGAMKVGHALSAMEAAIPDQLAGPHRKALMRLHEAAPPLPTHVVHRLLADPQLTTPY